MTYYSPGKAKTKMSLCMQEEPCQTASIREQPTADS